MSSIPPLGPPTAVPAGASGCGTARAAASMPRRLFRSPTFIAGFAIILCILGVAVLGPLLSPYDPTALKITARFKAPQLAHPFGTDNFGRDIFSRVAAGSRMSLFVGLVVVMVTGIFGTAIGALSGYQRGVDNVAMRIMDAFMAFPSLLLAIAITAALGPSLLNVVIALAVAYIPRTARIVRGTALVVREQQYVEASRVAGASTLRILLLDVIPNCVGALVVQLSFVFAYAVLAEATLSYLGVGLPPPTPTWGNMIADGREYIVEAYWMCLFPGLAITMTVLGFNLLGDGLRDVLDPHLRAET